MMMTTKMATRRRKKRSARFRGAFLGGQSMVVGIASLHSTGVALEGGGCGVSADEERISNMGAGYETFLMAQTGI